MPICRRCHQLFQFKPSSAASSLGVLGNGGDARASTPPAQSQMQHSTPQSTTASAPASQCPPTGHTNQSPSQCRYHPDMFVCRPHAADHYAYEINDQFMKDLQGWPAKFWDCCGAETPDAPGCVVANEHVPAYE